MGTKVTGDAVHNVSKKIRATAKGAFIPPHAFEQNRLNQHLAILVRRVEITGWS